MDIKEQDILGESLDAHWYYAAKSRALLQLLDGKKVPEVLDVGAGSGFFSRKLLDSGLCNAATCVDTGYPADRHELHGSRKISFVRGIDTVSQRLVLMMDVIEHVDDDVGFMRSYTDRMPIGADLVVSVP